MIFALEMKKQCSSKEKKNTREAFKERIHVTQHPLEEYHFLPKNKMKDLHTRELIRSMIYIFFIVMIKCGAFAI